MTGALNGLRVIESTQHLAGPSCAMFLADMGAEVVKIERPGKGDASRLTGKLQNGESAMFTALNRNTNIEYIDMPEAIRGKYQYFTEARMDRLRAAGYDKPFTSLEDGIMDYVQNYLVKDDPYL